MKIQADLAYGYRAASIEACRQCVHMRGEMMGQEHRMQAEGRMQPGMIGAQRLYPRPTAGVDGRYDHRLDASLAGAFDHCVAIDGERLVIEMDVAVDQLGRRAIFVHWQ